MKPGQLRERVTIQSLTRATDDQGGAVETWSDVATVWAMVRPARGSETQNSERTEAIGGYRFVMRNRTITEVNRLVWRGETYNIRDVKRMGFHPLYIDIDAERGAA